jgi:hypothetical protein
MGREDEIKLIAYQIWEGESCPDGKDCEHWFRAETIWEEQNKKPVKNDKIVLEQPKKHDSKAKPEKKSSKRAKSL